MFPCTRVEVAGFNVFELLKADGVEKEEGELAYRVTLVKKKTVCM